MQFYDECIAQQLMDILEKVIKDFEAKHHLDLMAKFEPEWWCYDSDMSYQDMSELLKEFFKNHYPSLFDHEINKKCFDVFDQTAEECKDKNIMEFHDKIIETTKKFLNDNVAPVVDKYWPKIEEAMSKAQKYFPGLEINKYEVGWDKDCVCIIYFTRNGQLISDEFDPYVLFDVYHIVDELCGKTVWEDCGVYVGDIYHCTDGWYDDLEELLPEDRREYDYIGNYTMAQHYSECCYDEIMNVFRYFDKNNQIKIKSSWDY